MGIRRRGDGNDAGDRERVVVVQGKSPKSVLTLTTTTMTDDCFYSVFPIA